MSRQNSSQPQAQQQPSRQQSAPGHQQDALEASSAAARQLPPSYLWEMSVHHLALPLLDPQVRLPMQI